MDFENLENAQWSGRSPLITRRSVSADSSSISSFKAGREWNGTWKSEAITIFSSQGLDCADVDGMEGLLLEVFDSIDRHKRQGGGVEVQQTGVFGIGRV